MVSSVSSYSSQGLKDLKVTLKEIKNSFQNESHLYIRFKGGKVTSTTKKEKALSFSEVTKLMDSLTKNKHIHLLKNNKIKDTFSLIKKNFDEKEVQGNCLKRWWKNFIKNRQSKKAEYVYQKFANLPYLLKEEKQAINDYTAYDYTSINTYLRLGFLFGDDSKVKNQVAFIRKGLEKLPNERATLFRGVALPSNVFEDLQNTHSFQDKAFLGFTRNKQVARNHACKDTNPSFVRVLFKVKTDQAKDISSLSFIHEEEQHAESESLFKDSQEFRVKRLKKIPENQDKSFKWKIVLATI